MNAHHSFLSWAECEIVDPAPVDLLSQAIARIKPDIDAATSLRDHARIFWAGVVASRGLGASDVVARDFWQLAFDAKLIWNQRDRRTRYGLASGELPHSYETVGHLIRWGLRGWNPFGERRHDRI